jgi:hypothetical protein
MRRDGVKRLATNARAWHSHGVRRGAQGCFSV